MALLAPPSASIAPFHNSQVLPCMLHPRLGLPTCPSISTSGLCLPIRPNSSYLPYCQVLHCVMYPRLEFDLPILSLDLVASSGRVTLAIIDPCPVSTSLQLPTHYLQGVR